MSARMAFCHSFEVADLLPLRCPVTGAGWIPSLFRLGILALKAEVEGSKCWDAAVSMG